MTYIVFHMQNIGGKNEKVLKSAAAILMVLTLAFSAFAIGGVFAEETEPLSSFAVSAKGSGADSAALGTVSWWKSDVDGKYYMFMPSKPTFPQ